MSQERASKRVRKGTKSCIECRQRKVRCVWLAAGGEDCENCLARGRTCEMQVAMVSTSDTIRMTSRGRIGKLENNVSSLWTAVRSLEAKFGCEHTIGPAPQQTTDGFHDDVKDDDSVSGSSISSPANPPTHLLQLFDNGLFGSFDSGSATPSRHALKQRQERLALWKLMPPREDMRIIATHASSWLSLYKTLFPTINLVKTGDEMLSQYDSLQDPNADPVAIGALLISVAMTVQQAPDHTSGRAMMRIKDASSFIKDVSDVVDRVIISNDTLVGTLEGIETALLFLRLLLGCGRVRKLWMLSRRIIALAELIGLPRASAAIESYQRPAGTSSLAQPETSPSRLDRRKQKAEVWESIRAVDRIVSMMWSLPLATAAFPLPKRSITDSAGRIIPQSYLYNLAEIGSRFFELDNIRSSGQSVNDLFNAVISADQELRSLASLAPKSWWQVHWSTLSVHAILQFWHHYLIVRTHLHLALMYEESQQFPFTFITCLDACHELAKRYVSLRPILPPGFFANQAIDLKAFTAAVFLLLASHRDNRNSGALLQTFDVKLTTSLLDQVVEMMETAAERAGGDFARQAAAAIRSLSALLQEPQASNARNITLILPLVGKMRVSRKSHTDQKNVVEHSPSGPDQMPLGSSKTASCNGSITNPQSTQFKSSELELMDILSYSMETPEDYPFLTDETFLGEQWLTWT